MPEPEGYGSASGAVEELKKIGAIEGFHYRMSTQGERITDFVLAIDNGPMVAILEGGFQVVPMGNLPSAFAVLNPAGMEFVGAPVTAAQMRDGKIPAEAAYVLAVE